MGSHPLLPLAALLACSPAQPGAAQSDTRTPPGDTIPAAVSDSSASGSVSRVVDECSTPRSGWIWCDDFEQNRLASYFEYVAQNGSFVRDSGAGTGGSWGMRATFAAGQRSAGALHLAFGKTPQRYFRPVDAGTAIYREVFWRFYFRNQDGWRGGGGDKMSRITSFVSPTSWAQAMMAHVWSGSGSSANRLVIDPASGTDTLGNLQTTTFNDFSHIRWLGMARSATPVFGAAHVGAWHCIEARVRLNDPGQDNGAMDLWIDGRAEASRAGLNFMGAYAGYGLNALFLENYWGAGAPVAQSRFFDNLVVSTQRVGC